MADEHHSPYNVSFEATDMPVNAKDITLNRVTVSVGGKLLFHETIVKVAAGHRYGFMGPNGQGKTSLLRLMAWREVPMPKNMNVLLVEQEEEVSGEEKSAITVVLESHTRMRFLLAEVERLQESDEDDAFEKLQEYEEELDFLGAASAESKARKILAGLGFPPERQDLPTKSFSGGWRKRIKLACAVFLEPDLLMLDEPTNHLDLNAVIWLETYLPSVYNDYKAKRAKSLIVVSHDVEFLDNVCTDMCHIDNKRMAYYRGSYKKFVKSLSEKRAAYDKEQEKQAKMIKGMKKKMSTKAVEEEMARRAEKAGKEKWEAILDKRREYRVSFPFQEPAELREACIAKLEECAFHYPVENAPILFENLNFSIWTDSRIAIVGPNGIGKSTLLNLLDGTLEPTTGYCDRNRQVRIGRYSQHFVDQLPLDETPCSYLEKLNLDRHKARQTLGSFGLDALGHMTEIEKISGGQKARVALAGISVRVPHVLLFDEPTNHLDLESIQALTKAINTFKGGVIIVSHDARMLRQTVKEIWVVGNKTVTKWDGDFDSYRDQLIEEMGLQEEREELEKERIRRNKTKGEGVTGAAADDGDDDDDDDDEDDDDESSEDDESDETESEEEEAPRKGKKKQDTPKPKAKGKGGKAETPEPKAKGKKGGAAAPPVEAKAAPKGGNKGNKKGDEPATAPKAAGKADKLGKFFAKKDKKETKT